MRVTQLTDGRDGGEVARLLRASGDGEAKALDRVLPLVYEELHCIAARYTGREQLRREKTRRTG